MQCPTRDGDQDGQLIAFAAGHLAPQEELAVRRHIANCEPCARFVQAQADLWSTLDEWEPLSVSPDFDAKVYARIAADIQQPWYKRIFRYRRPDWAFRPMMSIAAACAVVLLAFLLREPAPLKQPPQSEISGAKVDIEQVERALDDVEMLKQLGMVAAPPSGTHHEKL